jgi:hypothetical protein
MFPYVLLITGDSAAVGLVPVDRLFCVPAFQRVCPYFSEMNHASSQDFFKEAGANKIFFPI